MSINYFNFSNLLDFYFIFFFFIIISEKKYWHLSNIYIFVQATTNIIDIVSSRYTIVVILSRRLLNASATIYVSKRRQQAPLSGYTLPVPLCQRRVHFSSNCRLSADGQNCDSTQRGKVLHKARSPVPTA